MGYVLLDDKPQGFTLLPDDPASEPSLTQKALQHVGNAAAGAVRGAGSIGATLLYPIDKAMDMLKSDRQTGPSRNEERRQAMDSALQTMGAEPDSWVYKGGKLAGEIAGTAGAGGALAQPLRALAATRYGAGIEPLLQAGATALESGGFRAGEMAGTRLAPLLRIGAGAAVGGASAGMVDPSTAGMGALIGGAMPVAAQAAGAVGNKLRGAVTGGPMAPEVADLATRAKELGINIPADRLVNSRPLNAVAAGLNYVPFSGRAATEDAMNSQLNRALSRTFGQDSPNVTMALRNAQTKLGNEFDHVLRNNTVAIDRPFFQELSDIGSRAARELGDDALKPINSQIEEIISKGASGTMDGQAAYNIKRTLDRIGARNTPEAWHALELKRALMDALNRSIGPDKAAAFAEVRQQYGNMLALEKLAKNGAEGEISVARLANMRDINNQPLQELADIAAQFVKPREGQHGAAQRALAGVATFGMGGWPALVAGAGAGRLANLGLNSNAARGLLMPPTSLLGEAPMGLLTQGAYRAAPLLPAQ